MKGGRAFVVESRTSETIGTSPGSGSDIDGN
jgi:hypothetical protein